MGAWVSVNKGGVGEFLRYVLTWGRKISYNTISHKTGSSVNWLKARSPIGPAKLKTIHQQTCVVLKITFILALLWYLILKSHVFYHVNHGYILWHHDMYSCLDCFNHFSQYLFVGNISKIGQINDRNKLNFMKYKQLLEEKKIWCNRLKKINK